MEEAIVLTYDISADDFTRAGEASSDVKRKLKQMGVSPDAIRKVAIAMYEGEINMVIHAKGGVITVEITPEKIKMILACLLYTSRLVMFRFSSDTILESSVSLMNSSSASSR